MTSFADHRPVTGFHEYGVHSSTLGNTTWIARSSRHARVEVINYEGAQNVGVLTIRRIRSNVTDKPTETGERRLTVGLMEEQLRALLNAEGSARTECLKGNRP